MKKYEFTGETIRLPNDRILRRIRALRDVGHGLISGMSIKAGSLGGFIEGEKSLSHEGNCWVGDRAQVYEDAIVKENAEVCGKAVVRGLAIVSGSSTVRINAIVSGSSIIRDSAAVSGSTQVLDNALIEHNARLYGKTIVCGTACICGNANIGCEAIIRNGKIFSESQILLIAPLGSRSDSTTFVYSDGNIYVNCGCFTGDIVKFENAVNETHAYSPIYRTQYLNAIEFVKKTFHDLHPMY